MKLTTKLFAIVLMLVFSAVGCAGAHSKDSKPMLIDKFPTNFWNTQILLTADQHKEEQKEMVNKVEKLFHGKYRIRAQHVYLLPSDQGTVPNPVVSKMDFNNVMMDVDPDPKLVFANETIDWPYINIWKTSGPHPEYVALALYRMSDDTDTLLGYFELEPTK